MRLLQSLNYIMITLCFNVVTSFTLVTSSARNTFSSELRQGTSYKANLKAPDLDSKLCSHGIPLRMSKYEDMFSDQEEGTGDGIDTSDFEFVNMNNGEFSDEFITEMQDSAPDQLTIMKDLLGINGFTYVLAALITFFFSMNLILGPGWLGQQMGLEGTGTFTQISDSLPDSVDLSKPEFLL